MKYFTKQLKRVWWLLKNGPKYLLGFKTAYKWKSGSRGQSPFPTEANPLREFFKNHKAGRGIMKWDHYFDAYHKHFERFIGKEVHVLEIGVHSGGSIQMWKEYFGPNCHIYGVDIDESSKAYEDDQTKIFIGDQGDRRFWETVKQQVPKLDIVIDDGSHNAEDQIITLQEMLPHLRPGGIFFCEDVKRFLNAFTLYVQGLSLNLNAVQRIRGRKKGEIQKCEVQTTNFQKEIGSVHFYPYITVIEKNEKERTVLEANKHGDDWRKNKQV